MKEEIYSELKELSPLLADLKASKRYNDVPDQYFEALEAHVLSEINLNILVGNKRSYNDIPKNYFESLTERSMGEISIERSEGINKTYDDIPNNYFDALSENVMAQVGVKKQAKVVSFYQRYKWLAAAAMFLGIVFTISKLDIIDSDNESALANSKMEKSYDEMLNEISEEDASLLIEQFSTEEDIQFIKSHDGMSELNLNSDLNTSIDGEDLDLELTEEDLEFLKTMM